MEESIRKIDGIKSYKGIPSLKISQYRHPAWTTMVFGIPRSVLRNRMNIEELNYNSIYVLTDTDRNNETCSVYVGQAKPRNSGMAVINRLREHESDRLADDWKYAYVFTSVFTDENGWDPTTLNILENEIYNIIPKQLCLNGNEPNKGSYITSEVTEILSNIKTYLAMLIPDIFGEIAPETEQKAIVKNEISIQVKDLQTDWFGTSDITTPLPTVKAMVDILPSSLFVADTKFLDPACKGGEFLLEIYNRLMESDDLISRYPNEMKRAFHILEEQLYGVAISDASYRITNNLLYGDLKQRNIRQYENYENIVKGCFYRGIKKGQESIRNFIFGYIFDDIFTNKDKEESIDNMKFDVVIGNPPYSDSETRGGIGSGNALYPYFMALAEAVGTYHSLIVPSGWMIQYPLGSKHEIIDRFRQSKHITELHDFEDASKIFSGVSISAGVCYYLYDSTKEVKNCKHTIISQNDSTTIDSQPLYDEDAEVIFRDPAIININSKIREVEGDNFKSFADTCAGAKLHFGDNKGVMESNWTGYSNTQTETYNIMYFLKSNNKAHKYNCKEYKESGIPNLGYGWVNKKQIPKNSDDYKRHKVIVGQAFTASSPQVMDIPQYVGNNSVCSHSYLPIFSPHNTKEECLNICKYIKTRFFRYLVNVLKIGQTIGNRVYKLIPTLNFYDNSPDIDWSQSIDDIDEQLYKRYGIEEYAEYIKKIISPME